MDVPASSSKQLKMSRQDSKSHLGECSISKWILIWWLSTIRWQIDFPHQGARGCKLPNDRFAVACSIADQSPVDGHVQVSEIEFFAPQAVACSSFINDKAEHCCCLAACVAKQKKRFGGNQL
jgi:hypothetical protein